MFASPEFESLPDAPGETSVRPSGARLTAEPNSTGRDFDAKFHHLREECARTMTLIERLRASPLHRFASTKLDIDDRLAWSGR